jgi:6-pyruvoyltetrahydropterin/6-carboxytetrahydropterin synthase
MMPSVESPVVHFSRRYRFSSSHRLHIDALTDTENRETFGKCNNPHGHGHNYVLELTVSGPVNAETGMVVNMVDLDRLVHEKIVARFDLENLNHDPAFAASVPSTENLCRVAWQLLSDASLGTARLRRLRIEETSNNSFVYAGEPGCSVASAIPRKEN